MSKAGRRIIGSARQALAFAEGRADAAGFGVHIPAEIDVKAIRARLGLSQGAFARTFGVSVRTIQDWEIGRRVPSGPARALLTIIAREPEAVRRALAGRNARAAA
ncbi:MAG: helix-turn-helix domain-containing protein [Proteobacteria bacterium]|nr:helix-turn-helix domain-containing protein [Pseudomonadota bacterium]